MPHQSTFVIRSVIVTAAFCLTLIHPSAHAVEDPINFNTDIRPILSNKCFACHGPDEGKLEAGLRLDDRSIATSELDSGSIAIVVGKPDESELLSRVLSDDEDIRMPPAHFGKALSDEEIAKLRQWIEEGAEFAKHWSYVKPERPDVPAVPPAYSGWPRNAIDHFTLRAMLARGLKPSQNADRRALARRVSLDLIGLPPSIDEVEAFVEDTSDGAYEKFVESLLQKPAFGEHWARKWLDLARYADSAGYADDPPRTIWAYRDWVIKAINHNMPFDQFTIEQMAGDLLPNPTEEQLIATAFHRNTLTNNEGGTQDEEFRNVAVVDRVNTTMAVWMGTTMACAQCHTHKYDPITQTEYFRFFAILNSTQDADKRDESPVVQIFTDSQQRRRDKLAARISQLKSVISQPTADLAVSQQKWERSLRKQLTWTSLAARDAARSSGQEIIVQEDGKLLVKTDSLESLPVKDNYTINLPLTADEPISALRLSVLPHASLPNKGSGHAGGNFVVTGIKADLVPEKMATPEARFVRITNRGKAKILSLAEVQVLANGTNVATSGKATQQSTAFNGPPELAIDGNTSGDFEKKSVTHTDTTKDPWWELDLGRAMAIERVVIWNRTDNNLQSRLKNFSVELLDAARDVVWTTTVARAPNPSASLSPTNVASVTFSSAVADYRQPPSFEAANVLTGKAGPKDGWAIGGSPLVPHHLVLVPSKQIRVTEPTELRVTIEHQSTHARHLLGHFAFSSTADPGAASRSRLPAEMLAVVDKPATERTAAASQSLAKWYRENAAEELAAEREELAKSERQLADMKPATSVPVLRELAKARETRLQHRGNYLDKGDVVTPGTPAVFHSLPDDKLDRLAMAKWLIHEDNPLTSRVIANRYWESIFGRGIVLSSEEFGSQGELPTHPELLDWLAIELRQSGWDTRALIRRIVTSATYRQSSVVTGDAGKVDPDNRWLARGPRVRLSAEMIRDQALFASGLLSQKMFGPPVRPPQPNSGLTAAFGGSTDWKTSEGEDRYRRGLYTTWRRSNPYPSMATFDAPNREVCTVRRNSTNTPLQSLVTLNDPVYVEAAQSLARLALKTEEKLKDQIVFAFKRCTLRVPNDDELFALLSLYKDSRTQLASRKMEATQLATKPLGALPDGFDVTDTAAMTVVANVMLNLDEMFLKR